MTSRLAIFSLVVVGVVAAGQAAAADGLDEHLLGFADLLAERWVGHYSPDSEGLTHIMVIESILNGKAVRLSKEVPEISYSSETSIFWNAATETVELLSLTSKGHVTRGTVSFAAGEVVFLMWPSGSSESPRTRLVFRHGEDGRLYDEFFRLTSDGWRQGHLVIYDRVAVDP